MISYLHFIKCKIIKICVIFCSTVWLAIGINPAHALVLGFDPDNTTAIFGSSISLDISVSDVGLEGPISAFDLSFQFNNSVLALTSISFSDALGVPDIDTFTFQSIGTGSASLTNLSLLSPLELSTIQTSPDFALASLNFDVVGKKFSTLDFTTVEILDSFASNIVPVAVTSGLVQEVPEPPVIYIFLIGLFGIIAVYWHRLKNYLQTSSTI